MRMYKRLSCLLLMLVLLSTLGLTALASDVKQEYDAKIPSSIDLELKDNGKPVSGGSLKICKVATRGEGTSIVPTSAFKKAGLPSSMDDKNAFGTQAKMQATAAKLLDFAEKNGAVFTSAKVNSSGKVSFKNLSAGLYLIATDEAPDGYCGIKPFLVDLPHFTDKGWDYYPSAQPKMVSAARLDPPIEKVILPKGHGKDDVFTFTMSPDVKTAPMPDPDEYVKNNKGCTATVDSSGALTITKKGPGEVEFGWMYYTYSDVGKTYTYTITEKVGNLSGYTYDRTAYVLTVKVTEENGEVKLNLTTKTKDGKAVSGKMTFTNSYKKSGEEKVPDTGQLWWPVAVMGIGGLLMVGVGAGLRKKRKTDR